MNIGSSPILRFNDFLTREQCTFAYSASSHIVHVSTVVHSPEARPESRPSSYRRINCLSVRGASRELSTLSLRLHQECFANPYMRCLSALLAQADLVEQPLPDELCKVRHNDIHH